MTYSKKVHEIVASAKTKDPKSINEFAKSFEYKNDRMRINKVLLEYFSKESHKENQVFYIDLLKLQGGEDYQTYKVISEKDLSFFCFDGSHMTKDGSKNLGQNVKAYYPELFDLQFQD